jgi:ring-1,2-phenylacetyl-CoA epoxidase subunit PaaB
MSTENLPVWEVFIQPKTGAHFEHCGSVQAVDKEMALQNARELYTRRQEGTCIWVVKTENIVSSNPEDSGSFFDPADDKVYRYPTFYKVSKKAKGL